ncbi:MAG: CPBP family glutamic-type intramembrane protease [Olegusella sp.]|nr:CPBP family glutamic-type intramembrane protease [Olegusella sp.]
MTYDDGSRPVPPTGVGAQGTMPQQSGYQQAPSQRLPYPQAPCQQLSYQQTYAQQPGYPYGNGMPQATPSPMYPYAPDQYRPVSQAPAIPAGRPPVHGGIRWVFLSFLPMGVYIALQILCVIVGDIVYMMMGSRAASIPDAEFTSWCITVSQLLAVLIGIPWYRRLRRDAASRWVFFEHKKKQDKQGHSGQSCPYQMTPPVQAAAEPRKERRFVILDQLIPRPKRPSKAGNILLDIVLILAIGVLAQIATDALLTLVEPLIPDTMAQYNEMMQQLSDTSLISVLSLAILAPIAEEIFFRGVTMEMARRITPQAWVAVVLQAAIFGLAHGNPIQSTYTFLLGLVLGVIALYVGGLPATMLLHFSVNSSSYAASQLLGWAADWGTAGYGLALAASLALGALCLFVLIRNHRTQDTGRQTIGTGLPGPGTGTPGPGTGTPGPSAGQSAQGGGWPAPEKM